MFPNLLSFTVIHDTPSDAIPAIVITPRLVNFWFVVKLLTDIYLYVIMLDVVLVRPHQLPSFARFLTLRQE